MSADGELRWTAARLHQTLAAAFAARGVDAEVAAQVADCLVEASLRGVDTHGVALVPTYLAELDGGRAKAQPRWREQGSGALRRLDAAGALGVVAACRAADRAAQLAEDLGLGAVVVAGSNHCGPASAFSLRIARRGLVGLFCTNSDALVTPYGGRRRVFGTNPLSLAAGPVGTPLEPGAGGFCLDMATSQVAFSRVRRTLAAGDSVDPGWASFSPPESRDPDAAVLHPLGGEQGYKGQGLAMMVTLLTAVLAAEPVDAELSHLFAPPYDRPRRVAHFVLALNPRALGESDPEAFGRRLAGFLRSVRQEPPAEEDWEVMVPGDPEVRVAARRVSAGVPLSAELAAFFEALEGNPEAASPAGP
ncbi:MAG: Ldh family oxidoreductase [Acidobacteriota bacterium]